MRKYQHYSVCDSTQTRAKYMIDCSQICHVNSVCISADVQTNGYGQRNRDWVSKAGNLHLTMGYKIAAITTRHDFLAMVCCYLLGEYIESLVNKYASTIKLYYKWPNDIYTDYGKISGILIELYKKHLLIGVGLNIKHKPIITADYLQNHGIKVMENGYNLTSQLINLVEAFMLRGCFDQHQVIKTWLNKAYDKQTIDNINDLTNLNTA